MTSTNIVMAILPFLFGIVGYLYPGGAKLVWDNAYMYCCVVMTILIVRDAVLWKVWILTIIMGLCVLTVRCR